MKKIIIIVFILLCAQSAYAYENVVNRLIFLEEKSRMYGVGIGELFSLSGESAMLFEGNLSWFNAYYVLMRGGGFSIVGTIDVWKFRIRLLGLGLMFYQDENNPFSVKEVSRRWDMTMSSGIDIKLGYDLQFRISVCWFLPNPITVLDRGIDKIEDSLTADKVIIDVLNEIFFSKRDKDSLIEEGIDNASKQMREIYLSALKQPQIIIGLRWEFK